MPRYQALQALINVHKFILAEAGLSESDPTPADTSVCHNAPELSPNPKLGFGGFRYSRASTAAPPKCP